MDLPSFLLDRWLVAHEMQEVPVPYDLASSTGPAWTLPELLDLEDGKNLNALTLGYAPPNGSAELRSEIGSYLGVDPDWVVVTTGASEALSILFCLASRPHGEAILPSLQFASFNVLARAWGLSVRTYQVDRDSQFRQLAVTVHAEVGDNTALALINSPHNPTGAVMAQAELEALANLMAASGVPLIVDEVYHPLYFASARPSSASISNVVVVGDMSKALSLAGLRIGWIVESDHVKRERIIDARGYFTISGSPLLEALGAVALRKRDAILSRLATVARRNLSLLRGFMARHDDVLAWVPPKGGTTAFPWFHDGRDSRPFCEACASKGVLLAPGDCFGQPSHFRVGFATSSAGFRDALEIIDAILRP